MMRSCEVCEALSETEETAPGKMHLVLLDQRLVALCHDHAATVRSRGVTTVEELRTTFVQPEGGRSLIDRRSPIDRRVFPARPEGRRTGRNRRDAGAGH